MMNCARRLLLGAGGCLMLLATSGCLRVSPKMPKLLATAAPIEYSNSAFDADIASYHAALTAGNLDAAKTLRNQIVFRVMAQIDTAYDKFESELDTHRAGYQTSTDAAQLGLTTAATLVGASAVKDILSSTATALQGATLSFDKNFFEQKTTASLVSQMRASRKTLQAQMLLNLSTRDVQSYPLEAAWTDVVNYYYAGTGRPESEGRGEGVDSYHSSAGAHGHIHSLRVPATEQTDCYRGSGADCERVG